MIQDDIYLEPVQHKYFDKQGREYTSVSKVLDSLEEKFDAEEMSKRCAGKGKYVGMSQQEVKDSWTKKAKESTDYGTKIHAGLESYSKSLTVEDELMLPMVKDIHSDYADYQLTYDECTLYHPDYMVAGTADKVLIPKKNGKFFDLCDYKTSLNKGGIEYYNKYGKSLKAPLSYLQACSFSRYTLQLSVYSLMIEILTGKQARHLWIRYIPSENPMAHFKVPVVYMKDAAIAVLESFKKNKTTNKQISLYPLPSQDSYEQPNFTL